MTQANSNLPSLNQCQDKSEVVVSKEQSMNKEVQSQISKILPLKLCYNKFNYTQVLRGQKTCIYEQEVIEEIKYFEVFKIIVRKDRIFKVNGMEKKIDAHEVFPPDEAFGKWAWSYRTYDEAKAKFDELER
jgi:ribosomal protein S12